MNVDVGLGATSMAKSNGLIGPMNLRGILDFLHT